MNEKQETFLSELNELLRKFSIQVMCVDGENISFASNCDVLKVRFYGDEKFEGIETKTPIYKP